MGGCWGGRAGRGAGWVGEEERVAGTGGEGLRTPLVAARWEGVGERLGAWWGDGARDKGRMWREGRAQCPL